MTGPKELGFWSKRHAPNIDSQYGILHTGVKYRVIKVFIDYNEEQHPVGEEWTFLAYSFLPYDSGLQWFVSFDGVYEWAIPLWLADPRQDEIERNITDYIERVE